MRGRSAAASSRRDSTKLRQAVWWCVGCDSTMAVGVLIDGIHGVAIPNSTHINSTHPVPTHRYIPTGHRAKQSAQARYLSWLPARVSCMHKTDLEATVRADNSGHDLPISWRQRDRRLVRLHPPQRLPTASQRYSRRCHWRPAKWLRGLRTYGWYLPRQFEKVWVLVLLNPLRVRTRPGMPPWAFAQQCITVDCSAHGQSVNQSGNGSIPGSDPARWSARRARWLLRPAESRTELCTAGGSWAGGGGMEGGVGGWRQIEEEIWRPQTCTTYRPSAKPASDAAT